MNTVNFAHTQFKEETKDLLIDYLFDLMPINFSWIDTQGIIQDSNHSELSFFGINDPDDFIGKPIKDFISSDAWINSQEVMKTGVPISKEEVHTHADGTKTYFLTMKTPIVSNDKTIGVMGLALNVTDQKLMQLEIIKSKQEAEIANKSKTEFLANMRHDLRTPFAGILSVAQLLSEREDDPVKKEYLLDIENSSQALLDHLNDILDYVKTEDGTFPILEREFEIEEVLRSVYKMMMPSVTGRDIHFDLIVEKPIPNRLIGDSRRLQRILMNLVSNAIKFTEKGSIRITLNWFKLEEFPDKYFVSITVMDTGIGIEENKKEEIFQKFSRLTPSYNGIYTGSGLGLNIVKQFLADIDGQYHLDSELGRGTKFNIIIPFKVSLFALQENTKKKTQSKRYKILLVEDYPLISKVTKSLLEQEMPCQVDIAQSGKEALRFVSGKYYDLILMDIGLSDMKGYEVTKQIRSVEDKQKANVKIFALTAHSEQEIQEECIKSGINRVLIKPLTKQTAKMISGYLQKMETRDVNFSEEFG